MNQPEWRISDGAVPYAEALAVMEGRVADIHAGRERPLPDGSAREDKIAAVGVRIRHWVSFHGLSINVEPDLSHYAGIVPCGIADHGVTSLVDLGLTVSLADLDIALAETFDEVFGAAVRPSEAA